MAAMAAGSPPAYRPASSEAEGDGSPAELSTVVEFVLADERWDRFFMLP